MEKYQILHRTQTRVRVRVPYLCEMDVQHYLKQLAMHYRGVGVLHFYKDPFVVGIQFERGSEQAVHAFLNAVDFAIVRQKQEESFANPRQTPYDIISNRIYRKVWMQLLLPQPVRFVMLTGRMVKFARAAWESLLKRELSMSVLDFVAIATSYVMGDHKTADTIMFLLNLGDELDEWSQQKSLEDLEQSLQNSIYEIWIEKDGERMKTTTDSVQVGDVFVAVEGQEIYFDGVVLEGNAHVNESSLTGEAFPIVKHVGDEVFANTIVEQGEVLVKITNAQVNSRLQHMVQLMKSSEFRQSKQQRFLIEKADSLVKYNFIGMAVTYLLTRSLSKALTFLLVDYSCALKLSSPITYLSAIKAASDEGIVIKGATYLDEYPLIDTFVFDKTGTLTTGIPKICGILPYEGYTHEDVLRIAACLEEHIYHPIATAVVKQAEQEGIEHEEMHGKLYHVASKGILSSIDDEKVVIGSLAFLLEEGIAITDEQYAVMEEYIQQYHLLYLGFRGKLIAIFLVDTSLREDAVAVTQALRQQGKRIVLITGDTKKRTENIESQITFDAVYTDVKPEDKYTIIQQLQDEGHRVLMIGDGLNDSAALSTANVGIVMAESSDIARQASDIILLNNQLSSLLTIEVLTERLQEQLHKNLKTTIVVNTSLIGAGLFNVLSPSVLATIHNLTTTVIIGQSFHLASFR